MLPLLSRSSSIFRHLVVAGLATSALAIAAPAAADGSTALTNVVALVTQRLALAPPVAQFKWQTGKSITDTSREQRLLADVANKAKTQGVDPSFARTFFGDQIEASKIVQNALFEQWRKTGGPKEPGTDLAAIRPKLDQLDAALIQALARIQAIRAQPNCQSELSQSLANWKQLSSFDSSQSGALTQALSHVCAGGGMSVQG
ncbi:chorismate mutase [Pararobbsia alpina]|uniref:Chorismate mutase n=1 Tax=Pararobbsia alpina TaxID=621374 RepID=A0A6S7CAM2_9BURK|nr:chorismate mutase [Pararobbsia alpina]CAB3775748.1 Secreted chorismate mutase [Pararobbsia alpina]